jgi:hypothetical protein
MLEQRESQRQIQDSAIQLECRLYGHGPVQAEGTVMGKRLYFRARWDSWSFSVADSEDVDPVDIQLPEQGFLREGQYGKLNQYEASWMKYDDAEAIIKRCAQEYIVSALPLKSVLSVKSSSCP